VEPRLGAGAQLAVFGVVEGLVGGSVVGRMNDLEQTQMHLR
jgi:hypothetical protein